MNTVYFNVYHDQDSHELTTGGMKLSVPHADQDARTMRSVEFSQRLIGRFTVKIAEDGLMLSAIYEAFPRDP